MTKSIGYTIEFSAEHQCWSKETAMYDSHDLRVDLLSSIFNRETTLLYTSIRIVGVESAIREFRKKMGQSSNVQMIHRFIMPNSQGRFKNALCNFNVRAEGTITQSIITYFPVRFSVMMEEGLENWTITFLGRDKENRSNLMSDLGSLFSVEKMQSYDITFDDLLEKQIVQNFDSLDWNIIKCLMQSGYYDQERVIDFREMGKILGVSASTISRRKRKLEKEALLILMREKSFSQ